MSCCEFVSQDALGRVLRKVDCIPRRGRFQLWLSSPPQRPSLPFQSVVQDLRVTARERNQVIDLNLNPALVSCDMHLLHFEMVEYDERLSRLEEVTPTEQLL